MISPRRHPDSSMTTGIRALNLYFTVSSYPPTRA